MSTERYKRQIGLIGEEGQRKLKNSTVAVIGAGGIGNIAAKFLASTGVGYIEIWDDDKVEASNLNRQVLFNEESVGKYKARSLSETIHKINPEVTVVADCYKFESPYTLDSLDVVLDCTDNLASSYYIEEEAIKHGIPLVFAKTSNYSGVVKIIEDEPFLEKCYPTKQLNKDHDVFPAIGAIIGGIQASFAIKLLLGLPTDNDLLYYDVLNNEMRRIKE